MITLFRYWQYMSVEKRRNSLLAKTTLLVICNTKHKKHATTIPSKTLFITIYIELVCIHFMNGTIITDC